MGTWSLLNFNNLEGQGHNVHCLFIDMNYETLTTHYGESCRTYTDNGNDSYDFCKLEAIGQQVYEKFNCSLPFLVNGKTSF